MEDSVKADGHPMKDRSLEDLEARWQAAKPLSIINRIELTPSPSEIWVQNRLQVDSASDGPQLSE